MPMSEVTNEDCMQMMARYPDKYFELAIVDPPYGIGVNHNMGRRKGDRPSDFKPAVWDSQPPSEEYFIEMMRVSRNQIVWGANHFIDLMPFRTPCWLMWDKGFSEEVSFAQFELAWTSFGTTCKKYDKPTLQPDRIHPTQKPVALYKWILKNYAKEGDKILDTHLGSQSSRIAAFIMGFDFYGCEIDREYFEDGNKRFKEQTAQQSLFGYNKTL
jgi:site-specific DNA-methyltransferase (adenine-specific)